MSRVRDSQTPCRPGAAGQCKGVEQEQLKHTTPHTSGGNPTCNCIVSGSMPHSNMMVVMAAPSIAIAKNLQVNQYVKAWGLTWTTRLQSVQLTAWPGHPPEV